MITILEENREAVRAWEELDQARADIEGVIWDRQRMRATRQELAELLGTIIRAALLPRLP